MNQDDLKREFEALEGIIGQNPETGQKTYTSYVRRYTNRLFGAPFQLLDSVDKRFPEVNSHVGSEYLRNFLLSSPILHIRPGMPKYTGGAGSDSILTMLRKLYFSSNTSNLSFAEGLLNMLAKTTIFGAGSKLQKRMYGFRETYYDYMQHVNYMCRSCAVFLELTDNSENHVNNKYPHGTFDSKGIEMLPFDDFKWENYRMLQDSFAISPWEQLTKMFVRVPDKLLQTVGSYLDNTDKIAKWLNRTTGIEANDILDGSDLLNVANFEEDQLFSGAIGVIENKVTSVEFMTEPPQLTENIRNDTGNSFMEQTVDSLRESVGAEIAYLTNSKVDVGIVDNVLSFFGNTAENATIGLTDLVGGATGGFANSFVTGAFQSLKGQKMIYPKIYKKSDTTMTYTFVVNLVSPYGDVYNYYHHIIVPLMHLIALAAPRMMTANSIASPYLVQAYMPGQGSIQLGIISDMNIIKNPNGNRVSVNGFPLEVQVKFTIEELYNAMSISPANDPASFLFNETLNDYMANLSGLIPSVDTYSRQREASFRALSQYIAGGGFIDDAVQLVLEKAEDFVNNFTGR